MYETYNGRVSSVRVFVCVGVYIGRETDARCIILQTYYKQMEASYLFTYLCFAASFMYGKKKLDAMH